METCSEIWVVCATIGLFFLLNLAGDDAYSAVHSLGSGVVGHVNWLLDSGPSVGGFVDGVELIKL